ncbi:MAG: hypothetical protein U0514_01135 [Candidatus Andersenbacteria bacterium]
MLRGEPPRPERSTAWVGVTRALVLLVASDVLLYFYLNAAGLAPSGARVAGFFVALVLVRWTPYLATGLLVAPPHLARYCWAAGAAELAAVLLIIAAHLSVISPWALLPAALVLGAAARPRLRSAALYAGAGALTAALVGTGLLTFVEVGVVGAALLVPLAVGSLARATQLVELRVPRTTSWLPVLAVAVATVGTAVRTHHVPATAGVVLAASTLVTLLSLRPRSERGAVVHAGVTVVAALAAYQLSNGFAVSTLAVGAAVLLPDLLSQRAGRLAYPPSVLVAVLAALVLGAYAAVPGLDVRSLLGW